MNPFFSRLTPMPVHAAHRGFRACFPENTLCAFEAAVGKTRLIELDVRLSRDGQVVVVHDPTLDRTSDVAKIAPQLSVIGTRVQDWSLDQMRHLDFGTWFIERDPFGTIADGTVSAAFLASLMPQRIMVLEEVLEWARSRRMLLNIEIKDMASAVLDTIIVHAVVDRVIQAEMTGDVLISSFNHHYLAACAQLAPEIALGALQDGTHPPDLVNHLTKIGACAYHCSDGLVDQNLIGQLETAGIAVNVYTVNEPDRIRQLAQWGAGIVFTDYL